MKGLLVLALLIPLTSMAAGKSSDVIKAELTFLRKAGLGSAIQFKIIESSNVMKLSMKDEKKPEEIRELKGADGSLFIAGLNDLAWTLAYKEKEHKGPCVITSKVSVGDVKTNVCQDEKRKRALVEGKVKELMDYIQ